MLILTTVAAYLLGSVPFGLVITRLFGLGDLRSIGSGNIGATNVLRTGSKPAALLTLICDVGKGAFAVLVARALVGDMAAIAAGAAAFIGHCFPIYLRFRGGKGVATFLGTVLALAWPVGLVTATTWMAVAALSRLSSLAALVAAASAPPVALLLGYSGPMAIALLLMTIVIYIRHSANIARIRARTEPRIGEGK